MCDIKRAWVNQPATTQPLHHMHGTRVLRRPDGPGFAQIYFIDGPVHSMRVQTAALSDGWPEHLN